MTLCAGFFTYPTQAQLGLQGIEGPWECRNSNGVAGIFITVNTLPTSQFTNILVYQRLGEQEQSGYFGASSDGSGLAVLDGQRLAIHFNGRKRGDQLGSFDLDVSFNPAAERWTGSWSFCEQSSPAVLDRPQPPDGSRPSVFVGDWDGSPFSTLHIRQSYDGHLMAWLDRALNSDRRNGEQLRVLSATEAVIVLEPVNSWGPQYFYEGKLSEGGKKISGEWRGGLGGHLNAPTQFRRLSSK